MDLTELNTLSYVDFVKKFGNVVEHCPVIAAAVWSNLPYADFDALHEAFCVLLDKLPASVQAGVLRCHPDLAGELAEQRGLSPESTNEQKSAGLLDISTEEQQILAINNARYIDKFHFPFVICVRVNKKESIMTEIVSRQKNSVEEELKTGIGEVKKICRLRLADILRVVEPRL